MPPVRSADRAAMCGRDAERQLVEMLRALGDAGFFPAIWMAAPLPSKRR
jgi:hypothetical protein